MATRVGIELSPAACRIVEIDVGPPWRRSQGETRVRSFTILPPTGPETLAKLKSLRRHQAAVVVWGGRSEHRQVMVTAGSYESMRREALASLSAAGLQTTGVWADIAPATAPDDRATRRPVVVSMASALELSEALRPLRAAGIRLRTVTTPATALSSLARTRQAFSVPDAIESYIALDQQVTCMALVRGGVLLAARDLPWGYVEEDYAHSEPRTREDITARLAEGIGDFVAAIGGSPGDIAQVCLCGGLPELRSMAASLMERLDVEVEPLDSLFGIDAARLPEPAEEFRERGAELRLAWAVAADWPPAINLLRARRRQASKTWLARAAVVAGAAAGLGGAWWVVERSHLWPTQKPVTRMAANTTARGGGRAAMKPPAPLAPPPAAVTRPPVVTPPPAAVTRPPVVTPPPAAVTRPPVVTPPPAASPPPPQVDRTPAVTPPPAAVAAKPPAAAAPASRTEPAAARARPAPPPEVALPFDAVLGTILYSADRKLAIIDNRIVGVGDEVRGARVTEITPGSVMLRDGQGRLRRLTLGVGGR